MIAAIAAWWERRGAARCHAGKHRWTWIADRIYCSRCQIWH